MSKIQLRINDLRKKKQIKQTELANQLGVSVQTVSKWENDICMPDISLLPDIWRKSNGTGRFPLKERKIQSFINKNINDLIYLHCRGLLISYGRKKLRVY